MAVVLVESTPDPASVGIAHALRTGLGHREARERLDGSAVLRFPDLGDAVLVRIPHLHIADETLDQRLRDMGLVPDVIIFLSKHKSESGRPTLTAHPVGNVGEARFGGRPGRLTPAPAAYLSEALRCLAAAQAEADYPAEVSFEATHHGPLLSVPAFFLELGSSEREWADPRGHQVLAQAVHRLLSRPVPDHPIVIGLGGGHYGPRFTELVLRRRVNVAHIIPAYHAQVAADPGGLAQEAVRASPGVGAVYYHDGTLSKESRDRWLQAFDAVGVGSTRSKDHPLLASQDAGAATGTGDPQLPR